MQKENSTKTIHLSEEVSKYEKELPVNYEPSCSEAFKTGFRTCVQLIENRKIEGFTLTEILLELELIKES